MSTKYGSFLQGLGSPGPGIAPGADKSFGNPTGFLEPPPQAQQDPLQGQSSGNFNQAGGAGGGFTNFLSYLYANPQGNSYGGSNDPNAKNATPGALSLNNALAGASHGYQASGPVEPGAKATALAGTPQDAVQRVQAQTKGFLGKLGGH